MEIRVYQEGDWFSLTDCNKDELPAVHTDQEPHFIVIGTIYFMSQWFYFFVPPTLFFLLHIAALQHVNAVSQLYCFRCYSEFWCKSDYNVHVHEASQLSTDVASDFGFWHQSDAAVSDVNLTDAWCLPYFNLLPPACQNENVICSPVCLLQPLHDQCCLATVWCLCLYTSWHIFQLQRASLQQSSVRWPANW